MVQENADLTAYNTFGVKARARYFTEITDTAQLESLFKFDTYVKLPLLVLGGGSNMLFTRDFEGLVLKIALDGISGEKKGEDIFVTAGAGEKWHNLVMYCVNRGYAGIENLSLIPGSAGASPIQNIGAYGVELKDVFHSLKAFEIDTGKIRTFNKTECEFGYRDSIFKNRLKGKYIITSVTLKLKARPELNTSYGAIEEELNKRGITHPGIKDISEVVSHIRVSKLPDPSTIGNAGSFFKNPVIGKEQYDELKARFPEMPGYPNEDQVKVPAGWLIEQLGWKGKKWGHTGTWKNQALVLVNHGGATGDEVFALSEEIINSVSEAFGIRLEREVNII